MIFFAFLASLATLCEPLGLPIWQFFRSFSQFLEIFHKKAAPSYLVSKNTAFFLIFHAREQQKSLKIIEKPLFFH
jgi:membrane glycosyltransferase